MEIPTVTPTGTLSGGTTQHGQSSKRNKIEKNMNEKQVQVLPKQFNPDLVIAGHGEIYRDWQSKSILKRLQPPPKGACEENFYKEITSSLEPSMKVLRSLCPKFFGVVYDQQNWGYLKLEDLTRTFKNPCIMDVKMGRVTWDPNASEVKRKREESKYPPLKNLGFQFLGCRIAGELTSAKLDKSWGRGLDEGEILSGLERFLSGAGSSERKEIIRLKILSRLCKIRDWFLTQSSFRFYASSILILYEGLCPNDIGSQASSDSDEELRNEREPLVDLRMIDFAHVFDGEPECPDENYIFGLNNLISSIEAIQPPS